MFKLKIFPKRKLFYKETSQYGIYSCELIENLTPNKEVRLNNFGTITIVGYFPEFKLEKEYTITCKEIIHKRYGVQYELVSIEYKELIGKEGQRDFLKEIVTKLQLDAIFKIYDNPVDEILNDTFDYRKVYGIGEYRYNIIKNRVLENLALYKIISAFGKYGLTYNNALYLHRKYKNPEVIVERINNNPYILMDLPNMGFKRADAIALNMGIENNDLRRINACIEYFLEKENNLGNIWTYIDKIEEQVKEFINEDIQGISEYIKDNDRLLLVDGYKLTTARAYETEQHIAFELERVNYFKTELNINVDNFLIQQEIKQGFEYNEFQKEAFHKIKDNNILVLTGGAGTGKSSTINGLLDMFDECGMSYVLMSPSAKAAKIIQMMSGREAMTIHRGLKWREGQFLYNAENPLDCNIIVVDEVSMIGIYLFRSLLDAIPNGTKLILIGDPYQIQSIEPGAILEDILQSKKFSTVQLTKVFRQAEESGIINIATKTRNGEYFVNNNLSGITYFGIKKDTIFVPVDKTNTIKMIIDYYKKILDMNYSDEDIMAIVPTNVGKCGTVVINQLLQEINNPYDSFRNQVEYNCNGNIKYYREGDKVIHIVNDYYACWYDNNFEVIEDDRGIFNGDLGRIVKISKDEENKDVIWVEYDNKIIRYSYDELDNINHAWCLTTHKMQGSASKVVIMGLDSRHYFMAKRALVYTGITRASELLIFCGEPWLVNQAIDNNEVLYKRTFLKDLLVNGNMCIKEETDND